MDIVQKIIEVFEDYLTEKGIVIDNPERELERDAAKIYGSEYTSLEKQIKKIIKKEAAYVDDEWHRFRMNKCNITHEGIFYYSSELENHLEDYSME